jgi:acyl dehydratase
LASPVYPGETVRTQIWCKTGDTVVAFRAVAADRDKVVLNNGRAVLRTAAQLD